MHRFPFHLVGKNVFCALVTQALPGPANELQDHRLECSYRRDPIIKGGQGVRRHISTNKEETSELQHQGLTVDGTKLTDLPDRQILPDPNRNSTYGVVLPNGVGHGWRCDEPSFAAILLKEATEVSLFCK